MAQTMSPFKIEAYLTWQNESDARKEALKNAEQLPGETDSAFQMRLDAMPQPRTWLQFAIDPYEDGAPKDPSANAPGMLDPTDPLNADSLLLNPEWARMIPGQDFESLYFYKQSQRGRASSLERISEELFPSTVSRTSAADYLASPWNIFSQKDGSRYEAHEVDNFWVRTGFNALAGTWNLVYVPLGLIAMSFAVRKGLPNLFAAAADIPDEVAEVTLGD